MFLDPTLLSGAIGGEDCADNVADGGNEDVAVLKDDPDDDNDADDDKDDEIDDDDDCESDEAVATAVVVVITDKDGVEDDDCSNEVSAGERKILPLKCDKTETNFCAPSLNVHLASFSSQIIILQRHTLEITYFIDEAKLRVVAPFSSGEGERLAIKKLRFSWEISKGFLRGDKFLFCEGDS